jgi:hypothetical protein
MLVHYDNTIKMQISLYDVPILYVYACTQADLPNSTQRTEAAHENGTKTPDNFLVTV